MSFCCPLVLAFHIQAVEYEFDFNLLSSVTVNQVLPPFRDNISILSIEFFTSKMKSVVLMPIVFVNKGQTPLKGNIAKDPEDDLDVPITALGHSSHQHTVHDESFSSVALVQAVSEGAQAVPSTSVLRNIPTASLVMDKQEFSPESINRLKALMSKENRTQTLIKVGTEEATTCFDAHTSQDEASYEGNMSKVEI